MKAAEVTFGANGRRRDIYEDESNHFLTSMQAEQLPSTSPPTLDCAVAQLSDWSLALQVCFPSACDTKRKRPREHHRK